MKIWDSEGEKILPTLQGHSTGVICYSISSDDRFIVFGSIDTALKVWDAESGEILHTLRDHSGDVVCCSISNDEIEMERILGGAS